MILLKARKTESFALHLFFTSKILSILGDEKLLLTSYCCQSLTCQIANNTFFSSSIQVLLQNLLATSLFIGYVRNFRWTVTIMIFSKFNREKNCLPEIGLYGTILAPYCYTALLSQHMFFQHKSKSAFSGICCSEVTMSKWRTPVTNIRERDQMFFWSWSLPYITNIISSTISTAQYF